MFGIGIFELIVVLGVALIVLGPKQLPDAARVLGQWFYRIRDMTDTARQEIEKSWQPDTKIKENDDAR